MVLKTLTKTLTFVNAETKADAAVEGSTEALCEHCSGELKSIRRCQTRSQSRNIALLLHVTRIEVHKMTVYAIENRRNKENIVEKMPRKNHDHRT